MLLTGGGSKPAAPTELRLVCFLETVCSLPACLRADMLSRWLQEWVAVPPVVVPDGCELPTGARRADAAAPGQRARQSARTLTQSTLAP